MHFPEIYCSSAIKFSSWHLNTCQSVIHSYAVVYVDSTRALTGTPGGNRRRNAMYEEEDDLTKDMDDPPSEPNIQEVTIPRVNVKPHRDSDLQPTRGSTLMDIDEEAEVSIFPENVAGLMVANLVKPWKIV